MAAADPIHRNDEPTDTGKTPARNNEPTGTGRPYFPERAVVTGGMPYGDKNLHFGHVGGVFIPADVFVRFLRDRIGQDNVLFVSGTDCYGSGIEVSYEQARASGYADEDIRAFVRRYHELQADVLRQFGISLDLFAASALDEPGRIHEELSHEVFRQLEAGGYLHRRAARQFFDPIQNVFLNGRQVVGRCPIQGCKSEKAYADECALGHQFNPADLIAPRSVLTGERPELRDVPNWYFDLEGFRASLAEFWEKRATQSDCRPGTAAIAQEFLKDPLIYVKRELLPVADLLAASLPPHEIRDEGKPSVELVFADLASREKACVWLDEQDIRYRTGKTLVPFRLSGNVRWGIPLEPQYGEGLTFWVWPESLWAPISFCMAALAARGSSGNDDSGSVNGNCGGSIGDWRDWWASPEATVYQFIGEDNVYFYGLAEMALFMALQDGGPTIEPAVGQLRLPKIIAVRHILYQNSKMSSSGAVKPPLAVELLDHYTAEQMRMHFFAMNLSAVSVNFQPQAFSPEKRGFDPVLKEGNLLTNTFNRLVRSCFYTNQKLGESQLPQAEPSEATVAEAERVILAFERQMANTEFHKAMETLELYIHDCSKNWAAGSKSAGDDAAAIGQLLADSFHQVRVLATLLHPMAPEGCDKIREYLGLDERLWSWEYIFEPLRALLPDPSTHRLRFLEPRVDFFYKHPSQFRENG